MLFTAHIVVFTGKSSNSITLLHWYSKRNDEMVSRNRQFNLALSSCVCITVITLSLHGYVEVYCKFLVTVNSSMYLTITEYEK